jgi:hypothetical protein
MCGALSEERTGLPLQLLLRQRSHIYRSKVSSICHIYLQFYMSPFYILSCQESGSLWIPAVYSFTCNSSIYVCM